MNTNFNIIDRIICFLKSGFRRINNRKPNRITDINPDILELIGQSKFRNEVASEYFWTEKTFYRKLKKAGIKLPPGRICPEDLIKIYMAFGPPPKEKRPIQ